MNGIKVREINAKGIITKSKLPDADFVVNPYVGCQHGCIYCYSEFMKRFTGHQEAWGSFVDVKINGPELADAHGQYRGKIILFSSVTDPYQPLEAKYGLTRRILERLVDEQPVIEILTKSGLVSRDLDVLKRFNDATVGISLSTLDRHCSRQLEPLAATPESRLDALKCCKTAGLKTYVFVSPIFPYITELEEIIRLAAPYADYFMFENLNLRPTNRAKVYRYLEENRPELLPKYRKIYDSRDNRYWDDLKAEIEELCRMHEKEARIYFHHGGF
ncbi:MAG: radical SAM protein [Candidatus Nealsonbacteria bacterium CG03_land_8_20_14_0_80_36_12]|uniref:Radical SAM protein n=1 Tax=Candidatus Nealsonbacteria bacterium CG03_land_8_20_14_0_80_36_12 TaxID=1974701 RepID=A0A2M7BZ06_9BACT|nr:MAG: radical SAM protein [Candidatus Nealsonbacteria bacterium CG03_land_8_20_14_0_80_36_12]